jgi:hypothetical protein
MVSIGYVFGEQIESAVRYLGGVDRIILLLIACSAVFYASRFLLTPRAGDADPT